MRMEMQPMAIYRFLGWISFLALPIGVISCADPKSPAVPPDKQDENTKTKPPASGDGSKSDGDSATKEGHQKETKNHVVLGSPELTTGIPGKGRLTIAEIQKWLDDPRNHEPLDLELPLGLNVHPSRLKKLDEPLTRARIELGRQLFFDTRLSLDNSISCASCHDPDHGYTIPKALATGINGQVGTRNPPTLYNRVMFEGIGEEEFWDGHAASIEDAVLIAITDPTEMGNNLENLMKTMRSIEGYRVQFEKIYGKVTIAAVGDAVASFVRSLVTGPSPFDYQSALKAFENYDPKELEEEKPELFAKYQRILADVKAHPMSESAKRGMQLYFGEKTFCNPCHREPALTDNEFHNIGVGLDAEKPDLGRYLVTGNDQDRGKFKTPPVRNAELTAPYMHDGSLATLEDVIDWYAQGGRSNPNISENFRRIELSEQDKKDLVEFIKACTGELPKVETGRLPE